MSSEDDADRALKIAEQIGLQFLRREEMNMQGAVLAELVSVWVASIQPIDVQEREFMRWTELVMKMVPHKETIMRQILAALYARDKPH